MPTASLLQWDLQNAIRQHCPSLCDAPALGLEKQAFLVWAKAYPVHRHPAL